MKFLLLTILTLSLYSCEKKIDFAPDTQEPKLVVEAVIENNQHPVVYLTRSLDFFSKISREQLAGSFVRNAEVTISDGIHTETLKEYEVPIARDTVLFYYTTDTARGSSALTGQLGSSYSLSIKTTDGKEYTSHTTIPYLTKTLDSLWVHSASSANDPSKVTLYGRFTDPPGFGNYIRYFTNVNSGLYLPGLNSVFDDQVVDGKEYDLQIERGVDRNTDIDFETYSYFTRGDIVSIKFCNIDKATFDFWRTMEYSYASIGNPFSSPTKVIGNISNGALGYFGGYAVQYASIIIPE